MHNKPNTNTLSQKQALFNALIFAEANFAGDAVKMRAARTFFVIEWLDDMNWHPEAQSLEKRIRAMKYLNDAFAQLEADAKATQRLDAGVSLFNHIYGWGLTSSEWRADQGAELVDELWEMITNTADDQPVQSIADDAQDDDFQVSSVCREDLESVGFDTTAVDAATMKRLAEKLGDDYCDQLFWGSLEIIGEHLGIPKRAKVAA